MAIYDAGRREPLPLPVKTSYAWAVARHRRRRPDSRSGLPVEDPIDIPGEDQAPAHERAWGKNARLDDLMQPLRPGEEFDGEDNRLGAYAARLWLPMLRAERNPDVMEPLRPARPAAGRIAPPRCCKPAREPARRSRWPVW